MSYLTLSGADFASDPWHDGGRGAEPKLPAPARIAILLAVVPFGWLLWGAIFLGVQRLAF